MNNNSSDQPLNAPLQTHRLDDAKEFVYAIIVIAATFGAGHLILSNGNQVAETPAAPNQASVIQSQ